MIEKSSMSESIHKERDEGGEEIKGVDGWWWLGFWLWWWVGQPLGQVFAPLVE